MSSGSSAAREHEGVRHARQRQSGVALAAAVAREGGLHQAAVQAILEVAAQDPVLDEDRPTRGAPLVVHGQAAPSAEERAVIDHGDTGCSHALTDPARERRQPLAVEIPLEPVPHRLVQQDPGPARAEDDGHGARGSLFGVEEQDGHARGLASEPLGRPLLEELGADAPAAARAPLPPNAARARDHRDPEGEQGLDVVHEDRPSDVAMRTALVVSASETTTFSIRGSVGPSGPIGPLDEADPVGEGEARESRNRVASLDGGGRQRPGRRQSAQPEAMWAAVGRGPAHGLRREIVGVRITRALAAHDAHAEAARDAVGGRPDDPLLEKQGRRTLVLEVEIGEVSAAVQGQRRAAAPSRRRRRPQESANGRPMLIRPLYQPSRLHRAPVRQRLSIVAARKSSGSGSDLGFPSITQAGTRAGRAEAATAAARRLTSTLTCRTKHSKAGRVVPPP